MQPVDKKKAVPVYDVGSAPEGFYILRDQKPINTPAGVLMAMPTKALADGVINEWRAQGDTIKPDTMPLTQLVATTLDIMSKKRDQIVDGLAAYAESDLLCHRADEPPELMEQQTKIWQPWLDWAKECYGAALNVGVGVMPMMQPQASLVALRDALNGFDDYHLAGLQQAVGITGSLILGLALVEKKATPSQLFDAAELDALFQMQKWGDDPVTTERHKSVQKELQLCDEWFGMLAD